MDYPASRRDRLACLVAEEGLDALAITNPVSVTYLTGFSGDSSVLIQGRDRSVLVSDPRYTQQISEECRGLPVHIRPPAQRIHEAVCDVLNRIGFRSVGFESAAMTVAELEALQAGTPGITWKGAADRVEKLRMVKDEWELGQIRQAIDIAERAFEAFRAMLRPGDTERELANRMEMLVRQCGGQTTCFSTIVGVGERAALPHAPLTDRRVGSAELLLVDWGVTGPLGYKSDLTRVLTARNISTKLREVYTVVLNAQQAAIRAVRPGVTGAAVDAAARAVIAAAGFGEFFGHGLGHGIGLQVHESPQVRPKSEFVLAPGMVCTIEPGIYLPDWGGVRIEDDILVTPGGCEVLTSLPRDLDTMATYDLVCSSGEPAA
jgi:Xaa-Pro aminopeptidase